MTPNDVGGPGDGRDSRERGSAQPRAPARTRLERIAVRSLDRIVVVPTADISRLEAEGNYVRIWADRPYLHKDTLTHLLSALDPAVFVRIHRSHAINVRRVRELRPLPRGRYVVVLIDGTAITSGQSYRVQLRRTFALN